MDPSSLKILQGAAGAAGDSTIGVEDVFKVKLYDGNNTARSINTGLDMTDGGMVWIKGRAVQSYALFDSERGATKWLSSQSDMAEATDSDSLTSFNNNGFSLGTGYTSADVNGNNSNQTYVSWSFKKQKKFFTCLTYSGTSTARTISHDLGSVPGFIVVKRTSGAQNWVCQHRVPGATKEGILNETGAWYANTSRWNDTAPTDEVFSVGTSNDTNESGHDYIAYLWAHEEAEFGPNSDQKIISCGGYTGTGSAGLSVTLPFEPQYLLIKRTSNSEDWLLFDTMRGLPSGGDDEDLRPNSNRAATIDRNWLDITSTGFKVQQTSGHINGSGDTYVYIAIAAETGKTMKAIETGSDVFAMDTGNSSTTIPTFDSGFPLDFALLKEFASSGYFYATARLIERNYMFTNNSDAESTASTSWTWDSNAGWNEAGYSTAYQSWMWKRHAGFDVVTYEANQQVRDVPHSLGKVPEMIWIKSRNTGFNWKVYHKGANGGTTPEQYYFRLNHSDAEATSSTMWNNTAPTSTVFTIGTEGGVNNSGSTYIAMLFASVDGVSKVGYYDGSSSTITVTTGFQPRFVIIKRATGVGQWSVFDTTRGWGSGNDQKLELSDSAAQANNYDAGAPTSTGFTVTSGQSAINNNGDKYIYYAHA